MKMTISCFVLLIMVSLLAPVAHADDHVEKGTWDKFLEVEGRGLLSLVGLPCELHQSYIVAKEENPKIWGLTYLPIYLSRTAVRLGSALNDIAMFPLAVPFTDDLRPITELMGLTDYAWEKEEAL